MQLAASFFCSWVLEAIQSRNLYCDEAAVAERSSYWSYCSVVFTLLIIEERSSLWLKMKGHYAYFRWSTAISAGRVRLRSAQQTTGNPVLCQVETICTSECSARCSSRKAHHPPRSAIQRITCSVQRDRLNMLPLHVLGRAHMRTVQQMMRQRCASKMRLHDLRSYKKRVEKMLL
jgi:hypothetical protein